VVTIGDVARVVDGYADQTNIVRVNGRRAAYMAILKKSSASTLAVIEATRDLLPEVRATAPEGLELSLDFDQSVFVRAAVSSVVHEAVIAAILVSLMILVFLGSWRSVVVACASIPLAIATAIIGLNLTGNTFNIMTLGGLSLSIGLLVDTATITLENIHRNRSLGKPLTIAILDGAKQISLPVIIATLAICIVFFPVLLLTGPARFLFTPMAIAVVTAMVAAYILSRTLVNTLARMLLAGEHQHEHDHTYAEGRSPGPLARFSHWFNIRRDRAFTRFQDGYTRLVTLLVVHRRFTLIAAGLFTIVSSRLLFIVGTDFFPATDTGMIKFHFRAPTGSRIERTEDLVAEVEERIRSIIPAGELGTVNAMLGVPAPLAMAFAPSDNVGGMDAEILISLNKGHRPTAEYVKRLRADLSDHFVGSTIYFQTADMVSQVLNFGVSSPIDIQIEFSKLQESYKYAAKMADAIRTIPGTADVHIRQVLDYPTLKIDVDRVRASQLALSQQDIANTMLITLSSSGRVNPSYFINPVNSVNYLVSVKAPMEDITDVESILQTPITSSGGSLLQSRTAAPNEIPGAPTQTLGNVAMLTTRSTPNEISHYTVQRVIDVTANVEGRDLGSVVKEIREKVGAIGELPKGMKIRVRGQGEVMTEAFNNLGLGLAVAIVLVYLLMVIMFQSWLDPLIIMIAVPGAFVGILWMLVLTGSTINVVSLMGAIMAVGIAVSNAILLVSFANDVRIENKLGVMEAAIEAGRTRLRPVLMTALAMILGMVPMAFGLGEGGEQNAPMGRAVIGGLIMATIVTLLVVPALYVALRKKLPTKHVLEQRFEAESQGFELPTSTAH
jgi:multidrug efflux pump subunit AcrB